MKARMIMQDGPFGAALPREAIALVRALVRDDRAPASVPELGAVAVKLAFAEGLGAMLGARVADRRVVVPDASRQALLWEHQMCIAANVLRERSTRVLVEACRDRGIPVLLLKGMALIQSTLRIGERSMVDVDVLVPPSRWLEASEVALRVGFDEVSPARRAYTAGHDYVRMFANLAGVTIEIHRFVSEKTFLALDYEGPDGIFARARTLPSGLSIPDERDLFLTLAAHAARHTFELPLRSFLDGLFLWREKELHLDDLEARARDWQMRAAFAMWMRALQSLDGEGDTRQPPESTWERRVGRLVWSRTTHASPWQRFLRMAWLTDSGTSWVRHVAARAQFRALDALQALVRPATKEPNGGDVAWRG